jgi:hypothetical protein
MNKSVIAILLLTSCAATGAVFKIPISYDDKPSEREFSLKYVNNTNSDVCIGSGNWPSSSGVLDNSGNRIYVIIDGTKHYLEKQSDYCESCVTRVAKGASVISKFNYSSFGIRDSEAMKSKQLIFPAYAEKCPT